MNRIWKELPEAYKGMILMVTGIVLLLHTLGIIQKGLNLIIITFSIIMIVMGLMRTEWHTQLMMLIKKK